MSDDRREMSTHGVPIYKVGHPDTHTDPSAFELIDELRKARVQQVAIAETGQVPPDRAYEMGAYRWVLERLAILTVGQTVAAIDSELVTLNNRLLRPEQRIYARQWGARITGLTTCKKALGEYQRHNKKKTS